MACFLVPTTEAIVTTVAEKIIRSKEQKNETERVETEVPRVKFSEKLGHFRSLQQYRTEKHRRCLPKWARPESVWQFS